MQIEEKVKEILTQLSGEENIENDAELQADLVLDSLAMVTMLVEIEEVFGIELDESDMNPFELTTVQNIIDMIKPYLGGENDE